MKVSPRDGVAFEFRRSTEIQKIFESSHENLLER